MPTRYTVTENRDGMGFFNGITQCDDGDYVSWINYKCVEAERDALAEEMTATQGQIADAQAIIERNGVQKWQPIATAPKDGTAVLTYTDGLDPIWECLPMYFDCDKGWVSCCGFDMQPSHWMPMHHHPWAKP